MENRRGKVLVGAATVRPCKKHPKHRQSPGVCAACLRERLSRLSVAAPSLCLAVAITGSYSSSSSTYSSSPSEPDSYYYSSCDSSPCASSTPGRLPMGKKSGGGFWSKLVLRLGSINHRNRKRGGPYMAGEVLQVHSG